METGHLNAFLPYEHKPLHHEDQLTRAFLILVRCIKLVEATFLELLRTRMAEAGIHIRPASLSEELGGLESVETQVWSSTKARLVSESGRLVSVVITDERLEPEHRVERSERVGVYDGFVKFRPDWVFVIENKPDHTNIWAEQLSSAFSENYEVEPTPVVLTWREIITRLSMLTENALVQDAAAALIEDFLEFVRSAFPELNPYDRLRLCKGNLYLLEQRCVTLMRQAKLGPVEYHRGWHHSIRLQDKPGVKEAALYPRDREGGGWEAVLELCPGDTMSQSRALYATFDVDRLVLLQASGWMVTPNFHLAYRSSNLVWAETRLTVEGYARYWQEAVRQSKLRQIPRSEWDTWFQAWLADGVMGPDDLDKIQARILPTRMPSLNVCPGLRFRYTWGAARAMALDDQPDTAFPSELSDKIADALATW